MKKLEKKNEEVGILKILKETPEKWVKIDVEMSDSLVAALIGYARERMTDEDIKEYLINWSFIDILKKQIAREKRK